ncbi:unnamed protein product [Pneumocystis jirovecii]|uniref:Uncharacterized protein n=1 Tax=Pneumocystis jirovecii TaxID=42068 RepID=L0PH88_PNEJI|nr:unnamed protein product [Pneumocystis jirovecii]
MPVLICEFSVPFAPPVVKIDGIIGCQARDVTSFSCPRNILKSFIARMSNTRVILSREHVAKRSPCVG